MNKVTKGAFLKYGIPCLAVILIIIQIILVNTHQLSKWKGGGYGMYTEIHYYYNQIYIPGLSVDSLIKNDQDMRATLGRLKLMPNINNLNKAARLVLKTTERDSVHIQIWKPIVNSQNGEYSRTLVNEIYLKKSEL